MTRRVRFAPFLMIALLGIFGVWRGALADAPYYNPSPLTLTVVSDSEIDLSWTPVSVVNPVSAYTIQRAGSGGGLTTIVANTGSTGTTYHDTNLSPNTTYAYTVAAINSDGTGPATSQVTATTLPAATPTGPPNPPTGVTATALSATSISVAWNASESPTAISGYKIERSGGGGFTTIVTNTNSAGTGYTDTNLSPGVFYSYRISGINVYGPSNPSFAVSAETFTLPGAPQSATAVPGNGQVTVSWAPPTFLGGGITGYIVTNGQNSSTSVASGITSTIITGLTNGKPYLFSVSAVNPSGQSGPTFTDTVMPQAPPLAPTAPIIVSPTQPVQPVTPVTPPVIPVTPPSTAAAFIFTGTLQVGSQGAAVTALQKRLTAEGVYTGPITGYFGVLTRGGVIAYQRVHGISQVGIVGPLTRASLNQ